MYGSLGSLGRGKAFAKQQKAANAIDQNTENTATQEKVLQKLRKREEQWKKRALKSEQTK